MYKYLIALFFLFSLSSCVGPLENAEAKQRPSTRTIGLTARSADGAIQLAPAEERYVRVPTRVGEKIVNFQITARYLDGGNELVYTLQSVSAAGVVPIAQGRGFSFGGWRTRDFATDDNGGTGLAHLVEAGSYYEIYLRQSDVSWRGEIAGVAIEFEP